MHVSAVRNGFAPDIWSAQDEKITGGGWRLDFGKLYAIAGGQTVGRAVMYGSRPPPNDSLWEAAEREGFEVVVFDRNASNREKKVDTQLAADVISDSYEWMEQSRDEVRIVAGDADYVPVIEKVRARGFPCIVVFWDHAARELKETASEFVCLDDYLDDLRR
jgi:NYN domain